MSPSATPTTHSAGASPATRGAQAPPEPAQSHKCYACRCHQVPRLPRATKVNVTKCQVPRLPRTVPGHHRRPGAPKRHQSQPRAISATPVDVTKCHACHAQRRWMSPSAKCHACHAKCRSVAGDQRRPSAPPEPAQCRKCHACHAKRM